MLQEVDPGEPSLPCIMPAVKSQTLLSRKNAKKALSSEEKEAEYLKRMNVELFF